MTLKELFKVPTAEQRLEAARAEIARLKTREIQLIEVNNRDLERRREAERAVLIREVQIEALSRWLHLLLEERLHG